MGKFVFLLNKPIAFLKFSLPSPSSLLKLPIDARSPAFSGVFIQLIYSALRSIQRKRKIFCTKFYRLFSAAHDRLEAANENFISC